MFQIKSKDGKRSENYDRYKKALGMSSKNGGLGMMPSERAKMERELAEKNAQGPAATIQGKTDTRCDDPEAYQSDEEDEPRNQVLDDFADDDAGLMEKLRAKRLAELKAQQSIKQKFKNAGQGYYSEIPESAFIDTLNKSMVSVVHFYHKDFPTCLTMDKHLDIIAKKHLETKFVKMDAEKAPFFVQKLNIRTLPTVCCFIDSVLKEKLIGFEDLGGHDGFKTATLERWLEDKDMVKVTEEELEDRKERQRMEREARLNPIRVGDIDDDFMNW
jgi:thiol-disulfide isomerase/thioredoxin